MAFGRHRTIFRIPGLLTGLREIRARFRRSQQPQLGEDLGSQLLVLFLVGDSNQFVLASTREESHDDRSFAGAVGLCIQREQLFATAGPSEGDDRGRPQVLVGFGGGDAQQRHRFGSLGLGALLTSEGEREADHETDDIILLDDLL